MNLYFKHPIQKVFLSLCVLPYALFGTPPAIAAIDIRMQTDLGGIDIRLRDDVAPLTVANFTDYMNAGAYDGTFIHRNIPGFVTQGGGYIYDPTAGTFFGGGVRHITENQPVVNEAGLPGSLSNIRGTLAMAKTAGDPDSATSEWFFNTADNSANLDFQNGGFTVFAEVLGGDMAVVDDISVQDVCADTIGLGFLCGTYSDTIFIGASQTNMLQTENLLLINHVGIDNDADGVIDRVENSGPGGGDANNDAVVDSTQANVTTFDTSSGRYITLEGPASTLLDSTDVLGANYAVAHPPSSFCDFKGVEFRHGFVGLNSTGNAPGGSVDIELVLNPGETADTYYAYGAEVGNNTPHWYEFLYDGITGTGAEIMGNRITLHYVDGARGDNDLDSGNGVIASISGMAFNLATLVDQDLILDFEEDGAPNNGDGNNDGVLDSTQAQVASFQDLNSTYLTIAAESLTPVRVLETDVRSLPLPGVGVLDGLNFAHGFIQFEVCVDPGPGVRVEMILPPGETPDSYYMYGPTPNNPAPHYYEFLYDGKTGAEIVPGSNIVTLHFIDGMRGDSDLDGSNGVISDPGGPVFRAPVTQTGGGGGGGCAMQTADDMRHYGGDWLLLLAAYSLMYMIRRYKTSAVYGKGVPGLNVKRCAHQAR